MASIVLTLAGADQALAQHTCKPTMAFTEAHYSPMKLPKLERTLDCGLHRRCVALRDGLGKLLNPIHGWKENAPDIEFAETFSWKPYLNVISKEFWVDEAVGAYRVREVRSCPCRK